MDKDEIFQALTKSIIAISTKSTDLILIADFSNKKYSIFCVQRNIDSLSMTFCGELTWTTVTFKKCSSEIVNVGISSEACHQWFEFAWW